MHLKCLELQGFKSFPEKIRLEFNKGVTCVVGPNGSGKSNIADAVRWVLGEQSVKSLRGGKMEDIIFAGTASRRPLGYAEVTMIMDNSDGTIPLEFGEIAVTRRIFRSGEGQYYINGTQCRLKDVHSLFMDTGIGREGYSIIGQGRIEEILSAKSEDRRLLFEEAAGIVKYKTRKRETEIKLEHEKQNLLRAEDIITELESQLEPLNRQAEKARRFLLSSARLKLVRVNIFLNKVKRTGTDEETVKKNIANVEAQLENAENEKTNNQQEIYKLKTGLDKIDTEASELNEKIQELRLAEEKKDNEINLAKNQIERFDSDRERILGEIEESKATVEENNENIKKYDEKTARGNVELNEKNEKLAAGEKEFGEYAQRASESESLIEKYAGEHIEKLKLSSDVNGSIQRASAQYELLEERMEELSDDKTIAVNKIKETSVKVQAIEKNIEENTENIERLNKIVEMLYEDRRSLDTEITKEDDKLKELQKKLNEANSRHRVLSELEKYHEGYHKSVKAALEEKKLNPNEYVGVYGAVGELLSVEEKFETAIEIALGGDIQNIVTETENDAKMVINFLKKTNSGRVTFLPISSVKIRKFNDNEYVKFINEDGYLCVAKDVISYDEKYENVIASLLGRVLVFDDIENAVKFSRKNGYSHICVTLEGELIKPGGSISGGSVNKSSHILSRAREIAKLAKEISALIENAAAVSEALKQSNDKLLSIKESLNKNRPAIQEAEMKRASSKSELERAQKDLKDFKQRKATLDEEENNLMDKIAEQNRLIRELKTNKETIENEISDILETLELRQAATAADRKLKDKKQSELSQIKAEIAEISRDIKSAEENLKRIGTDIETRHAEIEKRLAAIEALEQEKVETLTEIDRISDEIKSINVECENLKEESERLASFKEENRAKLKLSEDAAFDKINDISRLTNEKTRLEVKMEQQEEERRRIYDEMWEEYSITYQAALEFETIDESPHRLEREAHSLRSEIRNMGNINVGAIEEHKSVSERFEFMTKQRDDIVEAEMKLKQVIDELTELMEKQFLEQLGVISQNFGVVFSEIFGGGTAGLRLSTDKDVLTAGIEIVAQMPGKSLQNLSLFSGGERSLTAIALLFAILRMKPSPFCVLDEIEAALDDANVKRFTDFLKKFNETQFIVITHRKGTMESADVLYGVTMQEQGVSKLVSVQFAI